MRVGDNPMKNQKLINELFVHRVIIPVYIPNANGYYKNSFEVLKLSFESLVKTIHSGTAITIIDNACSEEVSAYLKMLLKDGRIDQLVINNQNKGKVDPVVSLMKGALEPLITVTDADVLFRNGWQEEVENVFFKIPNVGMVSPLPQPSLFRYYSLWSWYFGFTRNCFTKRANTDLDSIITFKESISDNYKLSNTEQFPVGLNYNGTEVILGAGHFCATFSKKITNFMPPTSAGNRFIDAEEFFLDKPVEDAGLLRVSTQKGWVYHIGNTTETWMYELFETIKVNNTSIDKSKYQFYHVGFSYKLSFINKFIRSFIMSTRVKKSFIRLLRKKHSLNMRKKRVLVTISFSFSIRYIVRTGLLEKMRLFCEPVILITWNQEDLIGELKHKGYEVHLLIPEQQTEQYLNIRRKIDYWFNHFRLKSPSQNIQKSFLSQYKKSVQNKISKLSEIITILKFYIPGYATFFFQKESAAIQQELGYKKACEWLLKMNLDAVFTVTPFHKQEDTLLRACKASGLKMVTSILSFDNITKRGWIPVQYDVYMVWNKYNKNELHRIYPFTKNKIIEVTGAAQFDFYWDKKYVLSLDNWKTKVGLQSIANKKIILYAGGPRALFPNEPQYLQHIDEAIETGLIKNNPIVLFRCHPVDNIERWKLAIGDSSNIYFDTSWSGNKNLVDANITDDDIAKLCSTLAYTDVHVNLCSTMTIDGSAFYKPQIGPAYDSVSPQFAHLLKRMYWQEHFMPVINVNGIALANSKEQLVEYINEALEKPQQMTKAAKRVVEEIISYADGKCSQRVVNVLEKAIA